LTVLTPAQILLHVREAAWLQARLSDGGGIGIYPGHAPLLAETVTAPVHYADRLGEHTLQLEAGILQVERDGVTIFTSGMSQPDADSRPFSLSAASEDAGTRFDRLAQVLLGTLRDQHEG
jgi:F0F1-type ATP synthase epsilon subunit